MTRYVVLCLAAVCAAITLGTLAHSEPETKRFLPMDKSLIALDSPEGRKLLKESKAEEAFWNLSQFYSPQPDLGSCSVASCTMVLNALPIERPDSKQYKPYKLFTPDNFFTPKVEEVLKPEKGTAREKVSASGMTLEQLASSLRTFPVKVECVYGSDSTIDEFRKTLKSSLSRSDTHVIVNYLRKTLNQESGGHISPLGAYNEKEDMVLILDTANYKYPWTWVKTEQLWQAMAESVDSDSKRSRGYVVVSVKSSK
jgi:hypothetical protein